MSDCSCSNIIIFRERNQRFGQDYLLRILWVDLVLVYCTFYCGEELAWHFNICADLAAGMFHLFNVSYFWCSEANVKTKEINEALRSKYEVSDLPTFRVLYFNHLQGIFRQLIS